ncbi:hypothetical protein RISK_006462 [Rhodopirellula islandica]|uniref:Uncharacterized protein n=1 Tax=Rhodopirellula islandica TaxID=595434 RepID=A0A0J1B4A6_RHOIS|nr:hypothetical protein RISK_006462 [Rhodopirellula islandica]
MPLMMVRNQRSRSPLNLAPADPHFAPHTRGGCAALLPPPDGSLLMKGLAI